MVAPRLLKTTATRRCRYLHIGESHTQGDGEYRASVNGTRDLTLTVAMASGGVLIPAGNGGIGGQTSPMIAARVRRALKLKPDLVGVQLGTNDALVLSSSAYVENSLDAVKRMMDDAGVVWYVHTLPPTNVSGSQALVVTINGLIKSWAAANGVRCVDIFPQLVAEDGLSWATNKNMDNNHWHMLTGWEVSEYIWSQISDLVPSTDLYSAANVEVSNLIFGAIANTGLTASGAAADPLFRNHRSFTQNSFTVDLPYLFNTQYGSGTNPSLVSSAYADVAGVAGKVWTATWSPNGSGGYTASQSNSGRIAIATFQGRRLRVGFKLGTSGFSTDNTEAYLAANANVPCSGLGISVNFYDADNTTISTTHIADPVDTTGSASGASGTPITASIPLDTQVLFGRQGASGARWAIDHDLLPVNLDLNVPAGAASMEIMYNVNFTAAATSPVSVSLAEFSVTDIGLLDMPETPLASPFNGVKRVTATATITDNEINVIGVWRCDATSGAITLNLPTAKVAAGRTIVVKKIDSSGNAVTIDGNGSETIDGATTLAISSQWGTARLYSNGKTWDVV